MRAPARDPLAEAMLRLEGARRAITSATMAS